MVVESFNASRLDTPDGKSVQERLTFTMAAVGQKLNIRVAKTEAFLFWKLAITVAYSVTP